MPCDSCDIWDMSSGTAAFLALAFRGPFSSLFFSQPTPISSASMSLFSTNATPYRNPSASRSKLPRDFRPDLLTKRDGRRVLGNRGNPMKRVAIYLRVSTSKQDTENQLRELSEVADRSGWEIWNIYEDA